MTACAWKKLGLILEPDRHTSWMRSHAALPVPLSIGGSRYRVYFSSRDDDGRPHVGWFVIDLEEPDRVIDVAPEPVLAPGPLGYFDDCGILASSAVALEDRVYLYTIGRNNGREPLFYMSIGLAVSDDGGLTFEKYGRSPIMGRSEYDPWMVSTPFVRRDEQGWHMYYISGLGFPAETGNRFTSLYHIKYASSENGTDWHRSGHVCLDIAPPGERNIARMCVLPSGQGFDAWYSYTSGDHYRIGYARSGDGLHWQRHDDESGIDVSSTGWDSEAVAYPFVIRHDATEFMLYNGNGYGRDGIGLAVRPA